MQPSIINYVFLSSGLVATGHAMESLNRVLGPWAPGSQAKRLFKQLVCDHASFRRIPRFLRKLAPNKNPCVFMCFPSSTSSLTLHQHKCLLALGALLYQLTEVLLSPCHDQHSNIILYKKITYHQSKKPTQKLLVWDQFQEFNFRSKKSAFCEHKKSTRNSPFPPSRKPSGSASPRLSIFLFHPSHIRGNPSPWRSLTARKKKHTHTTKDPPWWLLKSYVHVSGYVKLF